MGSSEQTDIEATRVPWLTPSGEATHPPLGVVDDSGQLTRLAVSAGADVLPALSAGVYRNRGSRPWPVNAGLEAARRVAPRMRCFAIGGPFTTAEDLEQLYRWATFDGFVGG